MMTYKTSGTTWKCNTKHKTSCISQYTGGFCLLLEDVLQEFIFDCRLRKISERTIKEYNGNNLRFFKYIDTKFQITELEQVTHVIIKEYIQYLTTLGRKETYINSIIKCFRAFFVYCSKEEYINKNPMDKSTFISFTHDFSNATHCD